MTRIKTETSGAAGHSCVHEWSAGSVRSVEDKSPVLQARGAEVQQQATTATRDAEIVDQLGDVDRADGV